MNRIVTFNPIAQEQLRIGANILADAVGTTLGPKGRYVVIDTYGSPGVTKDGVTVAQSIKLVDPIQNLGAQILNQSSARTARNAGDGTTTSAVLAQALVNGAIKCIKENNISPIEVKRQFEELLDLTNKEILMLSTPVDNNKIINIATISANNDPLIGKLIGDAFNQVGRDGILTVEDSRTNDTFTKIVDGVSINRGYLSPYFITDSEKMETVFENPLFFITDKKLRAIQEIVPILEHANKSGRPLVIIADEIEAQALALLVVNKVRANFPVVAIKAPAYGDRRFEILQDLSIVTGAELISDSKGLRTEDVKLEQLGSAKKIVVNQEETIIVEPSGNKELVAARAEEVRNRIANSSHEWELEKLTERLAKLVAKVAVLYVGAATETEVKEKKDRIDDAIRATRAAIVQGFVPGGGSTLYNISLRLNASAGNQDVLEVFKSGLQSPFNKIVTNAGKNPADIVKNITEELGYNALTDKYENYIDAGIIDPTLVVIQAITNAVSAANMIILSEVTIHDVDKKYTPTDPSQYQGE